MDDEALDDDDIAAQAARLLYNNGNDKIRVARQLLRKMRRDAHPADKEAWRFIRKYERLVREEQQHFDQAA
jgi:hypothetical protein